MNKDYYKILGVEKGASQDEIKKAFYKLASKHHPDKGGDAEKFKEANEAYQVLGNVEKRKQYDTFGSAGNGFGGAGGGSQGPFGGGFSGFDGFDFSGFQGGGFDREDFDLGDIFGDFFGGGKRGGKRQKVGRDLSLETNISFEESYFGISKKVFVNKISKCDECDGSGGKKGIKKETCHTCSGKGKVRKVVRTIFGSIEQASICEDCDGEGEIFKEKCSYCNGQGAVNKKQEININIPKGVQTGDTLKMDNQGEYIKNGKSGDLYIKIFVEENKIYKREKNNLILNYDVKFTEAVLGKKDILKSSFGNFDIHIKEGTQIGENIILKSKGFQDVHGRGVGDLIIKLNILLPKKISKKQEELIKELNKEGI